METWQNRQPVLGKTRWTTIKVFCLTIDALVARLTNAAQFVALVPKWGEVAGAIRAEYLGEKVNTLILILFVVF